MRWITTPEFDDVYDSLQGETLSFVDGMIKDLFEQHNGAWTRAGRLEAGFWIAKRRAHKFDVAVYWDYVDQERTGIHTVVLILRY